jgi:hypothetical protein
MKCPVCNLLKKEGDHRMCILQLFREDKIRSISEWERPVTIIGRREIRRVRVEPPNSQEKQ